MSDSSGIISMINRGGVYYNISGEKPEELFSDIIAQIILPSGVDPVRLYDGLCEREGLMTTSIGNGIALPHPRTPLVNEEKEERIYVCFLDKPVNFDSLDGKLVFVLFVILSSGSQSHLKVLSRLSYLFQQDSFRSVLNEKPDTEELITAIKCHL